MRKSALVSLALVVAALVALGLIVLFSASEANGIRLYKDPYFFFKRQIAYIGAGVLVAAAAAISVFCVLVGLSASYFLDLPAGASVVLTNAAVFLVLWAFSGAKGAVLKAQ